MDMDNLSESAVSSNSSHHEDTHELARTKDKQSQFPSTKAGKKTVTFNDGVGMYTYEEPGWFDKSWKRLMAKGHTDTGMTWEEELDKLTRFSPHNRPHISTTRPRLNRRVANSQPA